MESNANKNVFYSIKNKLLRVVRTILDSDLKTISGFGNVF